MARRTRTANARITGATQHAPDAVTVALYARVSTEDQAENETIHAQLDFLRNLASVFGWTVVDEYVDEGVSGMVPLDQRPDGKRLLTDAEAGRFATVVLTRVSRLGRRLDVALEAYKRLDAAGCGLRFAQESIDTTQPAGRLLFQILGSFAEHDHNTIVEQTARGRNRVAAKGHYTGGPIPLGYDVDEHKRFVPSTRLVPVLNITEAELVRDIFRRIASGDSTLGSECARLTALGIPRVHRYGGEHQRAIERPGRWGPSALGHLIHNPIYKGEGVLASRYGTVTRPVPALVDAETWDKAQAALIAKRNLSKRGDARVYLLRGLIRCENCGGSFVGGTAGNVRRYRCGRDAGPRERHAGRIRQRCDSKIIRADWLEDVVWQHCAAFIRNPGPALDEARSRLRERMTHASGFAERRRATLAALAEKETERERVLTLYRRGKISDDEAERELDAIAREAGQLREELESLRAQAALIDAQEADLADSVVLLARLRDELAEIEATNDPVRKRAIIERYVRQITVKTVRIGPRKLTAEVRIYLRLKPQPIAAETSTL